MGVRNGAVPALKGSTTVVDLKDNPSLMYKHYGVDIMTLIHPSLRHPDCAAEFSMLPLAPCQPTWLWRLRTAHVPPEEGLQGTEQSDDDEDDEDPALERSAG